MPTFGSTIREYRKAHNWSLREFAEKVGINFTYLSKVENDKDQPPSEETIRRMAVLLDADGDELVLLARKLPRELERDLLARPNEQVAEMYRVLKGKSYTEDEWREILRLMKEKGNNG